MLRDICAGLITAAILWAMPHMALLVSPALKAVFVPILAAVPAWVLMPTIFLAGFGLVSLIQKVISARTVVVPPTVALAGAGRLEVDLRSAGGVVLMKSMATPQFWVYLRLTNLEPYPLRVTHLTVEVWFGQPTLKLKLDQPFTVPAFSSKNDVGLSDMLDAERVAKIEQFLASKDVGKTVYLNASVICESEGGAIEKFVAIERREPEISTIIR